MPDTKSRIKRTRVCLFSTVQRPNDVRLFHRECRSLAEAGYDVHLVVSCDEPGLLHGVMLHPLPRFRGRLIRMTVMPWLAMFKALNTKADIYHFHDPELLVVGFLMRWLLHKNVAFDMRESTPRQIMGKQWLPKWTRKAVSICYRVLEWICLKGIMLIVANDLSAREHPRSYLVRNFPRINQELMSNAMDMSERMRTPMLIYVGGVWESRGALTYIELARRLREHNRNFSMMIIGPYAGKDFEARIKQEVERNDLREIVSISGFMDYQQAMHLVCRAAIGLALLEPIPNYTFCLAGKMLEYMICGTPVLCSRFDHWRPYVEQEGTGRMVDPENIDEIVSVCEDMLDHPEELAAMGARGMDLVRTKYNWDSEFKILLECYNTMLAK